MAISKYQGTRLFPLELTAAAQLLENRIVKITSGVPAYATYGDIGVGFTTQRGDANDYQVTVMPLDFIDRTFFLHLAGTVAAHAKLFATGVVGAVKAASATVVQSRFSSVVVATTGNVNIAPATSGVLSAFNTAVGITATAGQVVTRGASAWTAADPTAGDIYWIVDEGIYVQWSGTAWVEAVPVALAGEAGSSGETIMCYRPVGMGQISVEQLDSGMQGGWKIVCAGTVTIADNATSGTYIDDRIATTDMVFCSKVTTTSGVSIPVNAAITADTVTVTCTDPGADGLTVNVMVIRKAS